MTGPERNQEGTDFMEFDIVGIYEVPSDPESTTMALSDAKQESIAVPGVVILSLT